MWLFPFIKKYCFFKRLTPVSGMSRSKKHIQIFWKRKEIPLFILIVKRIVIII